MFLRAEDALVAFHVGDGEIWFRAFDRLLRLYEAPGMLWLPLFL